MSNPHPLQPALDRVTQAAFTAFDLLDIANQRQARGDERRARPDGRQPSLYRAIVTAAVGGLEETFEGMALGALSCLGVPQPALATLDRIVGKQMQTPSSDKVKALLKDYAGFDPTAAWEAVLTRSAPAYRQRNGSGPVTLWTIYGERATYTGAELSPILNRFVSIRHSFAHQDSALAILNKDDLRRWFGPLWTAKAVTSEQQAFVRALSTVCAVTLSDPRSGATDPIQSWRIHETHAINSLNLLLGVAATCISALAAHLDTVHGVAVTRHDPLTFRIQDGSWLAGEDIQDRIPATAHVNVELIPYRPNNRT